MEINIMEVCNLNDRITFTASDSLLDEARNNNANTYINIAYCNYGGSFLDKVLIDYFIDKHPNNIVWEHTSWDGKNAFIFGEIANELISDRYILNFENLEDYYIEREEEEIEEAANDFIKWYNECIDIEIVKDYLRENATVQTFGVDYFEGNLINFLKVELQERS